MPTSSKTKQAEAAPQRVVWLDADWNVVDRAQATKGIVFNPDGTRTFVLPKSLPENEEQNVAEREAPTRSA